MGREREREGGREGGRERERGREGGRERERERGTKLQHTTESEKVKNADVRSETKIFIKATISKHPPSVYIYIHTYYI